MNKSGRTPITVKLGGPEDPFPEFPSTTSAAARRFYAETGRPLEIKTFGHFVIAFVETHCVLTDAQYAGQPFKLMDWQKRYLLEQFEVREIDGEWKRRYKWGLVGIPKKTARDLV